MKLELSLLGAWASLGKPNRNVGLVPGCSNSLIH